MSLAALLITPDQRRDVADLLTAWLPSQRWFAGKGRAITAVRLAEVTTAAADVAVAHVVVGVQLDGDLWQVYQVPMSLYVDRQPGLTAIGQLGTGDWVHDALTDPAAVPALLPPSGTHAQVDPERTHRLDLAAGAHPAPALQTVVDPDTYRDLPVRPRGAEQSNTSLILGDIALVKFFRRKKD